MANNNAINVGGGTLDVVEEYSDPTRKAVTSKQRRDRVLVVMFAVIMLAATVYNFAIATPRFSSDFSFVVRSAAPSRDRFSFMNFSASGESSDNSEAVLAYIRSRDMVDRINRDGLVSRVFATPGADPFSAFPSFLSGASRDHLFKHFQRFVSARYDEKANISYVEVQAFTPEDAKELAERIRRESEDKVNLLNTRAQASMTQTAEREVQRSKVELAAILDRLAAARNTNRVLDPKIETASAVKVAAASASELAAINVQLDQAMRTAPSGPAVRQLRARRDAVERELSRQNAAMAGGLNSLAARIRSYEELTVARNAAEKRMLGATLALANIRTNADRNRLYLEWVSEPALADEPLYPRQWWNISLTAMLAIAVLWIFRSLSELIFDGNE